MSNSGSGFSGIVRQPVEMETSVRGTFSAQAPYCVWFTGLSGAGKSTLADLLERRLAEGGRQVFVLDGDRLRRGLNRDLGFTAADRTENIRRTAEVARLMVNAGVIVLVALISPFRADRHSARALFAAGEFFEVFVDAPIEECERRDSKGLYARARSGGLKDFTGIDSGYEPPQAPDIHLHTAVFSPEACVDILLQRLT